MTFLLDTHVLYWHLFDPTKLSTTSRRAIDDGETGKAGLTVLSLKLAELYYLLRKAQVEDLLPDIAVDLKPIRTAGSSLSLLRMF